VRRSVCDGFSIEIKSVIAGAGDSACEEAHYHLNFVKSNDVSRKIPASKIMEARVRKTENITILMNHDTVEVLGDEQVVTGVKALNKLQMKNLRFQLRFLRSHWAQTKY
jgi:thioredoxin reductase (NADPH)